MNLGKRKEQSGFTLIEVIVIVVVVIMIAALLIPALLKKREQVLRVECTKNIKQIAFGYILWVQDNEKGNLPFLVPSTDGGLKDPGTNSIKIAGIGAFNPALRSNAWFQYLFIHKEIQDPKVLCCPADRERKPPGSWGMAAGGLASPGMQNNCISYCLCLDLGLPNHIIDLAGTIDMLLLTERHMNYDTTTSACSADVGPTKGVKYSGKDGNLPTQMGWNVNAKLHKDGGNVAMVDGSIRMVNSAQLRETPTQGSDNGELHFIYP